MIARDRLFTAKDAKVAKEENFTAEPAKQVRTVTVHEPTAEDSGSNLRIFCYFLCVLSVLCGELFPLRSSRQQLVASNEIFPMPMTRDVGDHGTAIYRKDAK